VLPQQLAGFRMMHRLAFADEAPPVVMTIMHADAMPVAEMADLRQPAPVVVVPLLCRFVVNGAVAEAVDAS
jgi:hypothetical protein